MTEIWKGAPVAKEMVEELLNRSEKLKERGIEPTLAVVRLGERADDLAYERGLMKRAEKTGVTIKSLVYPETLEQRDLLLHIEELNNDPEVDGILIFRPLPKHIDDDEVRVALSPDKDVDGITDQSQAGVYTGSGLGFPPCTAEACVRMLKHYGTEIEGKNITVIGRSQVIGKPVAMLLLREDGTVTLCHSRTRDLKEHVMGADIVIAAAGHPGTVGRSCMHSGQVVIDVAMNVGGDGKLCGDVDFPAADGLVKAVTPVPGGVGAVTTSVLMEHVMTAAEHR